MITDRKKVFQALQDRGLAEATMLASERFGKLKGVVIIDTLQASSIKSKKTHSFDVVAAQYGASHDASTHHIPVATGFSQTKKPLKI